MTDRARLGEAIGMARAAALGRDRISGVARVPCCDLWQVLEAAEAHLATLPKTKMVDVWRVEYAQTQARGAAYFPFSAAFHTPTEAHDYAAAVRCWDGTGCIRVTGPHQQEIPA